MWKSAFETLQEKKQTRIMSHNVKKMFVMFAEGYNSSRNKTRILMWHSGCKHEIFIIPLIVVDIVNTEQDFVFCFFKDT